MTLWQLLHATLSAQDTMYLAGLHRPRWSILKEAFPPFPVASGGLQRPPLNFKGCLLKSLKVCAGSKRLISLCKGVQGNVPGGVGSWCSSWWGQKWHLLCRSCTSPYFCPTCMQHLSPDPLQGWKSVYQSSFSTAGALFICSFSSSPHVLFTRWAQMTKVSPAGGKKV